VIGIGYAADIYQFATADARKALDTPRTAADIRFAERVATPREVK